MIDQHLGESSKFLESRTKLRPKLAFVLGSGLSGFGKEVDIDVEIPYAQIPHFAASTVTGHPGKLLLGHLKGVPVAVMQGRIHAYEGLSFGEVVFPVQTLAAFGCDTLFVTNAAGGLNKKMKPGDFMIIRDHINMTGGNPLRGPNVYLGPRFVDMTECYDVKLSKTLKSVMVKEKVRTHEGIYVGVLGPNYETAAEVRFYAKMGGGSVGMSTVAEVIAARQAGMRVVGLSCVTNLGTGLSKDKLSHDEVKDVANKVEDKFTRTLLGFVSKYKS